jgi:hypothetical protein
MKPSCKAWVVILTFLIIVQILACGGGGLFAPPPTITVSPAYACPGDTVTISWTSTSGGVKLNGTPQANSASITETAVAAKTYTVTDAKGSATGNLYLLTQGGYDIKIAPVCTSGQAIWNLELRPDQVSAKATVVGVRNTTANRVIDIVHGTQISSGVPINGLAPEFTGTKLIGVWNLKTNPYPFFYFDGGVQYVESCNRENTGQGVLNVWPTVLTIHVDVQCGN